MITNIKSENIIKNIFIKFLHKKAELKILKKNISLQKKVGINLENYKIMSGKYIIYETMEKEKNIKGLKKILYMMVNI